jgi:hypothetical protein
VSREGLAPSFGEHVVRPVPILDTPAAYRGSDAGEPSEVFHSVPCEGSPRLCFGEATKSEKAQGRGQAVEDSHVPILVGRQ